MTSFWHRHDLRKGILLTTISWFCFATLWTIAKLIEEKTTLSTMLFFRNSVGSISLLPWIIKDFPKSLHMGNYKIVLFRSFISLVTLVFVLLAVERITLVNATLLTNSAPFYVPIFVWIWFKSPIRHALWPAIFAGFVGIMLILEPDSRIFSMGSLYGILSGIGLAISTISIRIATKSETISTFLFYFFSIALLLTLPFSIADWKIEGLSTFFGLLGMGALSLIGQYFSFFAFKHGKSSQLAPFCYTSVLFAAIYSWILWNEVPTLIALIGACFIILAGIWIVVVSKPPKELKK